MIKILPNISYDFVNDVNIHDILVLLSKYDVIMPKKYWYAYNLRNVCRINYHIENFEILKKYSR